MDTTQLQRKIFTLAGEGGWRVFVAGRTALGRLIYGMDLGSGKQKLLLCGGFHGMEHMTSALLLRFAEEVQRDRFLPCRLTIVPMVNPDGVEIQQNGWRSAGPFGTMVRELCGGRTRRWQANARGVDINHNFHAGWHDLRRREIESGITGPAMTRFGGYYPESELETRALADLCRRRQFDRALALHTQGEEIYWAYDDVQLPEGKTLAEQMSKASGYRVTAPTGLAVGGGFKDWFLQAFHRPAFTVEAGKGENPLPEEDLDHVYEKLQPLLLTFLGMKSSGIPTETVVQ